MRSIPWNKRGQETVITGGAGFIGTNLADHLLRNGEPVVLLDDFTRAGVEKNYRWLASQHGHRVRLVRRDVRDSAAVLEVIRRASSVFHFAAQVAVTTSLSSPRTDFETNALGTLNVLEALRTTNPTAPLVFTSTNKVYGCLTDLELIKQGNRYVPRDPHVAANGLDEFTGLDFASPYGCSKGAADQYVRDYSRSYGLPTVVFRMSCIYGPHQMGTEDQGWVAHFLRRIIEQKAITIYGDGHQVRDLLFVDDLVQALLVARDQHQKLAGSAFNLGGGPANAASVLEVLRALGELEGTRLEFERGEWRSGDQRYYVSNIHKFSAATGWVPRIPISRGLEQLHAWLKNPTHHEASATLAA